MTIVNAIRGDRARHAADAGKAVRSRDRRAIVRAPLIGIAFFSYAIFHKLRPGANQLHGNISAFFHG